MQQKMLFIGPLCDRQQDPDILQKMLIEEFQKLGLHVYVLMESRYKLKKNKISKKIEQFISKEKPNFIFTINTDLLSKDAKANLKIPLLSFKTTSQRNMSLSSQVINESVVSDKAHLIVDSYLMYNYFQDECIEGINKNIHIFPSTVIQLPSKDNSNTQDIQISFIDPYIQTYDIKKIFIDAHGENDSTLSNINKAISKLESQIDHDFNQTVKDLNLQKFIELYEISNNDFKMLLVNHITGKNRLATFERILPLGLTLHGNNEWLVEFTRTPHFLPHFKDIGKLESNAGFLSIYNRTKITIHLPQIQLKKTLPYYVFDILASNSLLIIPYHHESEAFKIFSKDCPIVMYNNTEHLYELCSYYLENDQERVELVKKCNALVEEKYSARIRKYIELTDITINDLIGTKEIIYIFKYIEFPIRLKIKLKNLLRHYYRRFKAIVNWIKREK